MINISQFIKTKKSLPDFIKENITNKEKIKKIFPSIGLKNCRKSIKLNNKIDNKNIANELEDRFEDYMNDSDCYEYDCNSREFNRVVLYNLLYRIRKNINKKNTLQSSIKDVFGKTIFKKGENIINVLKVINRLLKKEDMETININGLEKEKNNCNLEVVFSSDSINGAWDIATMSMRGIDSCQRWSGNYKERLIGSILDPYTGIIYITDNKKSKYGKKMLYRCVVRFVLDSKNKPYLFIERLYSHIGIDIDKKNQIINIFKNFLTEKTNNKYQVVYSEDNTINFCIPLSKPIKNLNEKYHSYRDSGLSYKSIKNLDILNF